MKNFNNGGHRPADIGQPSPTNPQGHPSSAAPNKGNWELRDLQRLLETRNEECIELNKELVRRDKVVDVMKEKFVIQQSEIERLREREEHQTLVISQQNTLVPSLGFEMPLEKQIVDAIVSDLAARTGAAVINHVAQDVMDNFKFIPAARNMTIRFEAKDMLWADYTSLQAEIIEAWQAHVAKHLQCFVEDIDEHLKISIEVPKLTVSSTRKKNKKERDLDLDKRDEVG